MKAIIYNSKALAQFNDLKLGELAESFAAKNSDLNVTGYLCYQQGRFFQYIEGKDETVSALMNRIVADDRHTVTRSYEQENLYTRRFPSWSMNFLQKQHNLPEINLEKLINRHFECINSNPLLEDMWVKLLWSAVDRVASLQQRLVYRKLRRTYDRK